MLAKRCPRFSLRIPLLIWVSLATTGWTQPTSSPLDYASWKQGPPTDPTFFPLAVWVQSPRNAERYRQAGINLYVGLWNGPTEEQLATLKAAGMRAICAQNETALNSKNNDIILAWMHGDEPDNAQALKNGRGYGPPIPAAEIVADYQRLRSKDPTRPILLNLGQGVAYDNYIGRGVRRNHPEDYAEYLQGCDIASFDIYPAVHDKPEVAGKLEFVAQGVERLRRWSNDQKIVWNCIEASRISNTQVKPTPHQIRAEVWMSLIHGSRGLIYFVHQFEPNFKEASLLDDSELLAAVTQINSQVHRLAAVLNSPTLERVFELTGATEDQQIATMCKLHGDSYYLFAVNMRNSSATATIAVASSQTADVPVEVEDENRQLQLVDGKFQDRFDGYAVHIYRLASADLP